MTEVRDPRTGNWRQLPLRRVQRSTASMAVALVAISGLAIPSTAADGTGTGVGTAAEAETAASAAATQIVCEGSFPRQDSACWVMPDAPSPTPDGPVPPAAAITSEYPRNGSGYSAELCNRDNCDVTFGQEVAVPRAVRLGTLTFWASSFTSDHTCVDYLLVGVGAEVVRNLCSSMTGPGTWGQYSVDVTDSVSASRGGTSAVWFTGHTDAQNPTQFFVDDVRLDVVTEPRRVALSLTRHLIAKGTVQDSAQLPTCFQNVRVDVQRWRNGRWVAIRSDVTDAQGRYRTSVPDRPGRYRALAPQVTSSNDYECPRARSSAQRHGSH